MDCVATIIKLNLVTMAEDLFIMTTCSDQIDSVIMCDIASLTILFSLNNQILVIITELLIPCRFYSFSQFKLEKSLKAISIV